MDWKSANVAPLAKVNPPQSIQTDLRPISLTSVLSKQIEGTVTTWIWEIIKDKLNPNQYGFMARTSTTDGLIHLLHNWSEACDQPGATVRVVLLDFRKLLTWWITRS